MTQPTAEQINELKALVKRINDKLGFEGIGFRLDGSGSNENIGRSIDLLRSVAASVDA